MQRRDFVRTAIFGTGAALSLTLPSAHAALKLNSRVPLRTELARLEAHGEQSRWRSLDRCSSAACDAPKRVRIAVEALGFPSTFRALAIDAMFDTNVGLQPFRIGGYQPGSLSPRSKPFSFEADPTALAGFRVEHAETTAGSIAVASSAVLGASRPVLAVGRYLLVVSEAVGTPVVETLLAPSDLSDPVAFMSSEKPHFAWVTFSVYPLLA